MSKIDEVGIKEPPRVILELEGLTESERNLAVKLHRYVETVIHVEMMNFRNYFKLRENNLIDLIESMQKTEELQMKEINLKIGAITGHKTRALNKQEEITFSSVKDAIDYANVKRKELGLPPMEYPDSLEKAPG